MPNGDIPKFPVPRFTIYRIICERLEIMDRVTDAIECLQQMESELVHETDTHDERAKWVYSERSHTLFQVALIQFITFSFHSAMG